MAQALELYINGSLNVFNCRTNVNIEKRIVAFDIKELGKQLKKLDMLIVQDQIWGRMTKNRSQGDVVLLRRVPFASARGTDGGFSWEIWRRFRKCGGIPTGTTQNVKDLLSFLETKTFWKTATSFVYSIRRPAYPCGAIAHFPQQLRYVDNYEPGEGLSIYKNVLLPFRNPIQQHS